MKSGRQRFKIEIIKKKDSPKPKTAATNVKKRRSQQLDERQRFQSADGKKIEKFLPQMVVEKSEETKGAIFQNKKLAKFANKSKKNIKIKESPMDQQDLSPESSKIKNWNTYTLDNDFLKESEWISEYLQNTEQGHDNTLIQNEGNNKQKVGLNNFYSLNQPRLLQKGAQNLVEEFLENCNKLDLKSQRQFPSKILHSANKSNDLSIIQCRSINLISAPPSKKINQPLIPSKLLKPRNTPDLGNPRRKVKINKITTSSLVSGSNRIMSFNTNIDPDVIYMKKLKSFLDFLFKVNFSNKIYIPFQLKEGVGERENAIQRIKVYVVSGNNSELVKLILKKRFWYQIIEIEAPKVEQLSQDELKNSFIWSPLTIGPIHENQRKSGTHNSNLNVIEKSFTSHERSKSSSHLTISSSRPISLSCSPQKGEKKGSWEIQEENSKILSRVDSLRVEEYILSDGYILPFDPVDRSSALMSNHIPHNACLGEKTKLFKTMFHFYKNFKKISPFQHLPLTYTVRNRDDPEFKRFLRDNEASHNVQQKPIWIVKPGEDTNRGEGIVLAFAEEIGSIISKEKQRQTHIIQSYIGRPLLYNGRKFDIRHFMLVTSVNGFIKGYWYKEGYIRTSSEQYSTCKDDLSNKLIHLTNDAIQRFSASYGKYEAANKVSYQEFQRYLDLLKFENRVDFEGDIVNQQMKSIMADVMLASYSTMDYQRRQTNFEIFGLDFMLDRNLKPWLIEINSNPCFDTNCPLLNRLIPNILESSFRIGLDPMMPPPCHFPAKLRPTLSDYYLRNLKFELIFDECNLKESIATNFQILEIEENEI